MIDKHAIATALQARITSPWAIAPARLDDLQRLIGGSIDLDIGTAVQSVSGFSFSLKSVGHESGSAGDPHRFIAALMPATWEDVHPNSRASA